ncbi:MAG: hypothetical protein AB8C13_10870 [Phycisphaerales bacterium]
MNQRITMQPSLRVEIELGEISSDLLSSTSPVELQGTLDVTLVDGFAPTGYWGQAFISASDLVGEFEIINFPPSQPGFVFDVRYTDELIYVVHTCRSELNLEGTLDVLDVFSVYNRLRKQAPIS